ncbi:hypothetical protein ORV05_06350 [Amycolatopsis cynarae]|uniref:Transmembrane protein n=1 Tax=Amycolatopsis cynarae TaxID=2995223 RepID=A0ABY7B5F6_9PSEU|nr:hypothetical protein [Amycolatopsis sp. HUAS 11-8]WAL67401.1 hypothetical protein ORV05_06350 [Amycolatopsis sp. HUAS 11-8]
MNDVPNGTELGKLGEDVDQVVRKAARTVELGRRGFVLSLLVFALLIGQLLPWVGQHAGWQVLLGQGGPVPQLFAATSTAFGVFASVLALLTRRWWLAWVCAMGGWFASVDGLLAIWSQQSSHANNTAGSGPGIGMIIALVAMVFLAGNWMKTAWSRT